jgi:predicted RNA-binding Zn ribbon-like protein
MDSERDIVLEFLTSANETDHLATPELLAEWLTERGLVDEGAVADESDLTRARRMRAALWSLLAETGGTDPRTAAALAAVTERAPVVFLPSAGGIELATAESGAPGALVRILAEVYRAQLEGRWKRFKACGQCGWVFFDASKNRSRRWCDMASCGSVVKSRSYRARRKAERDPVTG